MGKIDITEGKSILELESFLSALDTAIPNMTTELRRVPDEELSGSQRKAEMQVYNELSKSVLDMIKMREQARGMLKDLKDRGNLKDEKDFEQGHSEKHARN
jgi:hypothetical protein